MASLAANGRSRLVARHSLLSTAPLPVTFGGEAAWAPRGSAGLEWRLCGDTDIDDGGSGAANAQVPANLDAGVFSPRGEGATEAAVGMRASPAAGRGGLLDHHERRQREAWGTAAMRRLHAARSPLRRRLLRLSRNQVLLAS